MAIIRGGRRRLVKQLQPKMYDFQVNAGLVVNDIATEAGERISAASALVLSLRCHPGCVVLAPLPSN